MSLAGGAAIADGQVGHETRIPDLLRRRRGRAPGKLLGRTAVATRSTASCGMTALINGWYVH
jgi:hypothetical protein